MFEHSMNIELDEGSTNTMPDDEMALDSTQFGLVQLSKVEDTALRYRKALSTLEQILKQEDLSPFPHSFGSITSGQISEEVNRTYLAAILFTYFSRPVQQLTLNRFQSELARMTSLMTERNVIVRRLQHLHEQEEDDWSLNTDQMIFMLQHHNVIEAAFENDDMQFLRDLADSEAYRSIFGDMSFDEAYDRYEVMLEDDSANS
jgi:hypothetical protein